MELCLDTANVAEVEHLARIYPLARVTVDPSIIAASETPIWSVLPRLRKAIGPRGTLFAQTMSRDMQGMAGKAKRLGNVVPGVVVKIPMTAEGLTTIKTLKKEDTPTLDTAVYNTSQSLLAALAGTKYVTPYVNHVGAQSRDDIRMVQKLQSLLETYTPRSKVLATSFRTSRQTLDCLLAGCEATTLPLDIAQQVLDALAVRSAIEKSEQDWNNAFGTLNLQPDP